MQAFESNPPYNTELTSSAFSLSYWSSLGRGDAENIPFPWCSPPPVEGMSAADFWYVSYQTTLTILSTALHEFNQTGAFGLGVGDAMMLRPSAGYRDKSGHLSLGAPAS